MISSQALRSLKKCMWVVRGSFYNTLKKKTTFTTWNNYIKKCVWLWDITLYDPYRLFSLAVSCEIALSLNCVIMVLTTRDKSRINIASWWKNIIVSTRFYSITKCETSDLETSSPKLSKAFYGNLITDKIKYYITYLLFILMHQSDRNIYVFS